MESAGRRAKLHLDPTRTELGQEGYEILPGAQIFSATEQGLLYGTFGWLQSDTPRIEVPKVPLRMLQHWDDLDGFVERGYAGRSLFDWPSLPDHPDPRLWDYARACASIGINAICPTNVNASAEVLREGFLEKAAALADVLRPYGIRLFLTARFSAPMELDGLPTADPLDPEVRAWWTHKLAAIYRQIHDFGGLIVKANSEGQPGPQDYGRTHAEGANLLAAAVAPHGGRILWRAFVYSDQPATDRAAQAYDEFAPIKDQFHPSVQVQIKNGPIDFQPREPFHPLFGTLAPSQAVMEFQITKEYLGFSSHLAFLANLWREVLTAPLDQGAVSGAVSGIVGVANLGDDPSWCGSLFDQANWFAFGRMAWDPELAPASIAEEWVRLTLGPDPLVTGKVAEMLLRSHEAVVNTMTPLGLAHLMGSGHHYGPAPWVDDLSREDWNPTYFHRADREGIGFDRTQTGSAQLLQYPSDWQVRWSDPDTIDLDYLLWFHHLGWDHELKSGRTVWQELVHRYHWGCREVAAIREIWADLEPFLPRAVHQPTLEKLDIQMEESEWWRDACLAYFGSVCGREWPEGYARPKKSLAEYRAIRFEGVAGDPAR